MLQQLNWLPRDWMQCPTRVRSQISWFSIQSINLQNRNAHFSKLLAQYEDFMTDSFWFCMSLVLNYLWITGFITTYICWTTVKDSQLGLEAVKIRTSKVYIYILYTPFNGIWERIPFKACKIWIYFLHAYWNRRIVAILDGQVSVFWNCCVLVFRNSCDINPT